MSALDFSDAMLGALLLIAFVCGCFTLVGAIAQAKCWSWINRNVLLERSAAWWRAIGP